VIGAVILAAGASSRFGSPKALANVAGKPAITRLCRVLNDADIEDIAVVVGKHADLIAPEVPTPARVVENRGWERGRTGSIKLGVRALPPGIPLIVWPVDHPAVRLPTIRALMGARGTIRIPTFEGKRGHPPVFDASLREEILALRDDEPLHNVVHRHEDSIVEVAVPDPAVLWNIDTPDDLKKMDDFLRKPPNARAPS
jgi:molybdenum cofactor cytidylyltransferase